MLDMLRPRKVSDMDQAIHSFRQPHKGTKIGNGLHLARNCLSYPVMVCDKFPWLRPELLQAQGKPLFVFIDVDDL